MTELPKIPGARGGIDIVSILIGGGNAIGTSTHASATGLPFGATPQRCWIWDKWGQYRPDRYCTPSRVIHEWRPLALGTGVNADGSTEQTVGPEFTLGSRLIERTKGRCANRLQTIEHHVIKFGALGARFAPSPDPRATWAQGVQGGLRDVFVNEYLRPAIAGLRDTLRPVYVDALYIVTGERDSREDAEKPGDFEAPRVLGERIKDLVDCVEEEMGVESLQTVVTMPRYNEVNAPRLRTDLARNSLENWAESDERVYLMPIDDLAVQRDMQHLTAAATMGLGMRMAHVWDRAERTLAPLPDVVEEDTVSDETPDIESVRAT